MAQERLQKIIASLGIASRRKAEELIAEGSVTVNGKRAKLGDKADIQADAIKLNGKLINPAKKAQIAHVYLAFHKPKGVICMMNEDPEGRRTLLHFMDTRMKTRVFPVGRLDYNGEGLVLLTNDGELAEKIQKNSEIVRIYQLKVKGHPDERALGALAKGVKFESKLLKPHSVQVIQKLKSKSVVEVAFVGMGAIEVKKLFEWKGFLVERVVRTSIGQIRLAGIAPGESRRLKKSQFEALIAQPELGLRQVTRLKSKKDEDEAAAT